MKNRFNLNEEEKKHIRGLHNINEQVVGYGEQGLGEDAGMDTPGGNPDYFYGDDSLDKLRKFAEEQDSEMSKEDIVNELIGIYSYSQDGATDLVNTALETLITNLGGFKDDINEQNYPDTTSKVPISTQIEETGKEEILEKLLGEAQRLTRFVENRRMGKDNWSNEDLVNIQENINKEITNYLK
jgi:hypothetical protein